MRPVESAEPVVVLDGVSKRFSGRGRTVTALNGLSLSAQRGEILGILGPNGAGKTTAIHVLATLVLPDEGHASVAGADVVAGPGSVRAAISLTGQFAAVDGELSGAENLVLFGRLRGMSRKDARRRAAELLADLSLTDASRSLVRTYSGGMRRRLDIAVSMMTAPQVLFLDEPTTGLDPHSRNELWAVIRRLRAEGVTIVLTTQYLEEADALADRIVVIDHGQVIAEGTPDELKDRVGPSEMVIRLDDDTQLAHAGKLLASWDAVRQEDALVVPLVAGANTVAGVMGRIGEAGLGLASVAIERPTLDDVFFSLTGDADMNA